MTDEIIELTPLEKKIDVLLGKSGFYLQTYRAIDAQNVLSQALQLIESSDVQWHVRAAAYRNMGQALLLQGKFKEAMDFFVRSYETMEDGNDKAAAAGLIAGYYLQDGQNEEALVYSKKALATATAPELLSRPYQIQGGIAMAEGNYPKAIELMNKAAALAEESHCTTDLSMIIMDISAIYLKMGLKETALSEIYRAERYVKVCRNVDLYMRCAIRRARILYVMGLEEEAKKLICALDDLNSKPQ